MLRIANLKLPLDAGPDAPLLLALKKLPGTGGFLACEQKKRGRQG